MHPDRQIKGLVPQKVNDPSFLEQIGMDKRQHLLSEEVLEISPVVLVCQHCIVEIDAP